MPKREKSSLRDALTQVLPSKEGDSTLHVEKSVRAESARPAPSKARSKKGWQENKHSLYLPHPAVYQALLDVAHEDSKSLGRRKKLNDLFLEGIDLLLKKRGKPSIDELIANAE